MNNVVLDGALVKDPEVRPVKNTSVVNFAILNKQNGKSHLIGCEAWGDVGNDMKGLSKGDEITVSGSLNQSSWEDKKTQEKKSMIRIRVNGFSKGVMVAASEEASTEKSEPAMEEIPF